MLHRLVLLSVGPGLTVFGLGEVGLLWFAVVTSGLYHGLSPGMGWPLAVSAALMEQNTRALVTALGYLALGHFAAILTAMLPFVLLATLVALQQEIQVGASLLLVAAGIYLLVRRRHPRMLARIPPAQLGLWSFAIAMAHGAGLMLVPAYLGLCRSAGSDWGHDAAGTLMGSSLTMALVVAVIHTAAMVVGGGMLAILVYRYLGLSFISRSWFNLDAVWAASLILVGGLSLAYIWTA